MARCLTDAEIMGDVGYAQDEFFCLPETNYGTDEIPFTQPRPIYNEIKMTPAPIDSPVVKDKPQDSITACGCNSKKIKEGMQNKWSITIEPNTLWIILFFTLIIICLQVYHTRMVHKLVKSFVKNRPLD